MTTQHNPPQYSIGIFPDLESLLASDPQSFNDLTSMEPPALIKLVLDYVQDLDKTVHAVFPLLDIKVDPDGAVDIPRPHPNQYDHTNHLIDWLEDRWTHIMERNTPGLTDTK